MKNLIVSLMVAYGVVFVHKKLSKPTLLPSGGISNSPSAGESVYKTDSPVFSIIV